jgi:predicted amidohydrolase YtcJ
VPNGLKLHTQGAAYQLHLNAGAIAKGKLADLIVVDRNPMTIPDTDIEDTQVLMTMLGGEVVWEVPTTAP